MTEQPTAGPAGATVTIDEQLYRRLRRRCDAEGVRFVDFVEEALENAVRLEEVAEARRANEKLLAAIRNEAGSLYRRGFRQGMVAAILLAQGQLGAGLACVPPPTRREAARYEPGDGRQLALFDRPPE